MTHLTRALPTDSEVRRLLYAAGGSRDPRSMVTVVLLLWLRLTIGRQHRLCWSHWDRANRSLSIPDGENGRRIVPLTTLVSRLLGRIPRSNNLFIFARQSPTSATATVIFRQLLEETNLSEFTAADFISWSDRQSPAKRLSTASA